MQIIRKSLESLSYVSELPPKIQTIIMDALITSTEVAFGTSQFHRTQTYILTTGGISCLVLLLSLFASFYVKELSSSRRNVSHSL